MNWNYKDRRRPDSRLKITPTQKKTVKLPKMTKEFNSKPPKEAGNDNR